MNPLGMNGVVQPNHPGIAAIQMKSLNGAMTRGPESPDRMQNAKKQLNTAIYDYFIKCEQWELCRVMKNSGIPIELGDKSGPKQEEGDSRDEPKRPNDLPAANPRWKGSSFDTAHLLDWYSVFWDILQAANKNPATSDLAAEYQKHASNQNRMQHQRQMALMQQGGLPPNMSAQQVAMMRSGGLRQMMTPQQHMLMQRKMMAANMPRDTSAMEGDGQRPRTPMSSDAPSSPKRQRIDGNPAFGSHVMPNGMGQQMDMQALRASGAMPNGVPHGLTQQQMQQLQSVNPQRANMVGQSGSPIVQPGMDPSIMAAAANNQEFYATNQRINGANGANGHALQDYQMQLMLLERQNRKRLEMAKQEHMDGPTPNGTMMQYPPNMSPSGSRQGPSPNPSEQMKRGTPKLNQAGIPGSPMPQDGAMQQRAEPSGLNYGQMGPGMESAMQMSHAGMRPPSSHPGGFPNGGPMNAAMMRGQQAAGGPNPAQMNGANFQPGQQGPMGPGGQQGPGQMGTPQQRAMPPPQGVPPTNTNATGRAPSPAASATAGTPQQSHKANPKKVEPKEKKPRKASNKKNNAAATAAENQDSAPATSTPATPITPAVQSAAGKQAGGAGANQANNGNGQQGQAGSNGPGQANTNGTAAGPGAHMDANAAASAAPDNMSFDLSVDDDVNLDFGSNMDNDPLTNFNFDTYIDDAPQDFQLGFDFGGLDPSIDETMA